MHRRSLITGLISFVAAPAVIRLGPVMAISVPRILHVENMDWEVFDMDGTKEAWTVIRTIYKKTAKYHTIYTHGSKAGQTETEWHDWSPLYKVEYEPFHDIDRTSHTIHRRLLPQAVS